MMKCPNHEHRVASDILQVCSVCIVGDSKISGKIDDTHASIRKKAGLVPRIPTEGMIVCPDCGNHCKLQVGEIGFCHNRVATSSVIGNRYREAAPVSWYYDPLPTNCVADWVCPISKMKELRNERKRFKNLAVFYGSCNSNCLFCQNASYQEMMRTGAPLMTPEDLARVVDDATACVCYFGGDPACNPQHSIEVSRILLNGYSMPICYETNGRISSKWLPDIVDTVKRSRGTIKFDLKAITPKLYRALTGTENAIVIDNFRTLAEIGEQREEELLIASILLIPEYVNLEEIERLCEFIAECDPSIPTALLGFAPKHYMRDLPRTSMNHAHAALHLAKACGLENVRIGNQGLLTREDYNYE
ncbi:MAG: radical SAM protein [Candidatus Thorarchaeota archaeon]